ncbi:MAG: hypothetical protein IJQ28_05670, partial [Clostridia bacterium]|nr:hypothetical protein [Clostridia bacterium]
MISKCKVCGGNINAKEDAKYVICEYCSTTYETDNGKIDINVSCNVNNTAKKKSLLPLLICLFLLVFVIVGGLIVMSLMKINTSLEKPEDNDVSYVSEIYEKNSELQRNENKNTIEEKNNKPEFVYIENVEEQVKLIRKKYYSTQNDLGALNVTQIGKYKIYKNSDGDIKKVDFALNSNAYDV